MSKPVSHKKIVWIGSIAIGVMFAFCFAMVPLYGLICKVTGVNTSVASAQLVQPTLKNQPQSVDLAREITVQFVATNHNGMPWDFYPQVKSIRVHPGEQKKVFFHAKNTTEKDMTVQAIPSMTPPESLTHFHKIECFCFEQQTLKAGESREMALVFQLDRDLPKDMNVITLAYTLFEATPKVVKKG